VKYRIPSNVRVFRFYENKILIKLLYTCFYVCYIYLNTNYVTVYNTCMSSRYYQVTEEYKPLYVTG